MGTTAPKTTTTQIGSWNTNPNALESAFMALASGVKGVQERKKEEKDRLANAFSAMVSQGMIKPQPGQQMMGYDVTAPKDTTTPRAYSDVENQMDVELRKGVRAPTAYEMYDMAAKRVNQTFGDPSFQFGLEKTKQDPNKVYQNMIEANIASMQDFFQQQTGTADVGSTDKGNLSNLKKQFKQLKNAHPTIIKQALEGAIKRGLITQDEAADLWDEFAGVKK